VVAVRAAGAGLEEGGGVAVADAERVQVGDEVAGVAEGEAAVELEAVGRRGVTPACEALPDEGIGRDRRRGFAQGGGCLRRRREGNVQPLAQGDQAPERGPGLLLASLGPAA